MLPAGAAVREVQEAASPNGEITERVVTYTNYVLVYNDGEAHWPFNEHRPASPAGGLASPAEDVGVSDDP